MRPILSEPGCRANLRRRTRSPTLTKVEGARSLPGEPLGQDSEGRGRGNGPGDRASPRVPEQASGTFRRGAGGPTARVPVPKEGNNTMIDVKTADRELQT